MPVPTVNVFFGPVTVTAIADVANKQVKTNASSNAVNFFIRFPPILIVLGYCF